MFILRERGQRRVRERENPEQPPQCQHRARRRARSHELQDRDLSRDQESNAAQTELLGARLFFWF